MVQVQNRGGVVLVPELWGVDASLTGWAQKLAAEGFVVVIVDLWARHGGPPPLDTPEEIQDAVARLDDGCALRDIAAAAARLPPGRPRVVLGFCVGGLYARLASAAVPGFSAAVEFYGRIVYPTLTPQKPAQPLDMLPGRTCPLLCHFADDDPIAPAHHVDEFQRRLANQAIPSLVYRYPGVGHAFMNQARPGYRAETSALAWARTLRFLDEIID
ncbi:MAG: hypothetical protein EXR71_11505 [Myxococcales bacterium]|nr:hypothetical protein [Myxococcales bacterium]